jgi:hypothetical protein
MGHLLGYARVSTTDQQPQLQVDDLPRAGAAATSTADRLRPPMQHQSPGREMAASMVRWESSLDLPLDQE